MTNEPTDVSWSEDDWAAFWADIEQQVDSLSERLLSHVADYVHPEIGDCDGR